MFIVYTPTLVRLGPIERYSSMQWRRRYRGAGDFELHMPYNSLLVPENIIRNGDEAGIIESVTISHDEENGTMAEVHGRFLIGYLARRIILDAVSMTDTPETIIKAIVSDNLRGIDFTIESSQSFTGSMIYENQYGNLLEEIEAIADFAELGIKVDFDRVFKVYEGLDRSTLQSTNPRAIFSRSFENLLSSEYYVDTTSAVNVVTDGTNTIGSATGIDRREGYAKDNLELALMREPESFTAELNPYGNLRYKTDYDLGDIVTIKEFALTVNTRIIEINEIYEDEGFKLEITFGYERVMKLG